MKCRGGWFSSFVSWKKIILYHIYINTTPLLGHIYKESGSKRDITIAALVSGISSGHRILQIQLFDIRSFSLETVSVCDVTKNINIGCCFWYNWHKSLLWWSAGLQVLMLVKAFLWRVHRHTLFLHAARRSSSTYLSCDLAAPGYSKYHLSCYLQDLLFPVNAG